MVVGPKYHTVMTHEYHQPSKVIVVNFNSHHSYIITVTRNDGPVMLSAVAETTTTPAPTISSSHWACSFEDNSGSKTMCDMSQSTSDTFDWTLKSGKTPSGETGPDKAYNGGYYVFIETSNPRKFGDKAA